jgi:hypothetical protein
MALPVLPVRHNGVITHPAAGDVLVSSSIGPDGEFVGLWASAGDHAAFSSTTTQPGWATFPDPRTPRPIAARVTVQARDHDATVRIAELSLAHPMVQVLPGGRVLVVAARCRWSPAGPQRNAIIYGPDGETLLAQTVGDGIEHVVTTRTGRVWIGYFDEGVYGNFGWGGAGGPSPIGAPGLVRFTDALQPDWRFPSHTDNPWGPIDDCYAFNVDGETASVCYYSAFPVVRVEGGTVTWWRNDVVSGARALAVSDRRVVLVGGLGPDHDWLVMGELADGQVRHRGEYRLVLPDGSPLQEAAVFGRTLHLVSGAARYRLDLDDIPEARDP